MDDMNQDFTLWLIFAAMTVLCLFFTGLYFILRNYSSKDFDKSLKDSKKAKTDLADQQNKQKDSKNLETELDVKSDVNKVSLKEALSKSRHNFWSHLRFSSADRLDQTLEQIEEALYLGDVGPQTVSFLVGKAQTYFSSEKLNEDSLKTFLKSEMSAILGKNIMSQSVYDQLSSETELNISNITNIKSNHPSFSDDLNSGSEILSHFKPEPLVLMVVGVNGVGKTTTIGKLAQNLAEEGKKVIIAAGDTFRAAAGEQLKVWTDRAKAEIYFPEGVKEPSAVAYGAVKKAQDEGFDVCIIDTAGRLHTQDNLMAELEKVKRVLSKLIPKAPHHTWIVLDANSGQNALFQAKSFHQQLTLSGVVLTKLDGTAKGGMALAVANELKVPIRFIGVGEKAQDLRPFISQEFVDSLI